MPPLPGSISPAALERAIAWAEVRYRACDVCAARCGVDRHAGPGGVCGLGVDGRVYKEYLHLGEEAHLLPSHAIYLTGCNLRCAFCSDDAQVRAPRSHGLVVPPAALARRVAERRAQGATNVNFVGGLPDVNLLYILRVLAHCPDDTHVVWNTNLWTTPEALDHLAEIVSTWLVDLKFGDDRCALKLAGVRDYWATLTALLPRAAATGGGVLVRHLLMPGHLDCCTRPTLAWLEAHLPSATVNLMTGYHPYRLAGSRGPMGGPCAPEERDGARALLAQTRVARRLLDGTEFPRLGSRCAP